ncbi:MAG TPA: HAD family hydrolase [Candidatus Eisenbacteria bacterium]|nr:HAD family hydrolase [Candidatus Eisenbacteria bacterium]
MSRIAYDAVLFDLFGTLIEFDHAALPEVVIDGRRIRSTIGTWAPLLAELVPGADVDTFGRAFIAASHELAEERKGTHVERPSRERFRRALVRLGADAATAAEAAPILARAHMQGIANATRFPSNHAAVLEHAARGRTVAVITNFDDTATAYDILCRHDILSKVHTVVVSEAVGLRKPHPSLIRIALRDLGVAPARALMVGDNFTEDIGAASAAGVDAAWIDTERTGVPDGSPSPRYVLTSFPEVATLLR